MFVMPTFSPIHASNGVTMVAGSDGSGGAGYSNGTVFPAAGTISAEPLPSFVLIALTYYSADTLTELAFAGDAVTALSGKSLIVDGVAYLLSAATVPPDVTALPGVTYIAWSDTGPGFFDGVSYTIRIE